MKWNNAFTLFLSILCFHSTATYACTNIVLKSQDGSVVNGRTLEFGPELDSQWYAIPQHTKFAMKAPNGQAGLQWKNRYGYLYLDYFSSKHPVDGMNEKGLSFGFLFFPTPQQQYPIVASGLENRALPYTHLGDWLLGNFSTIDEVKSALKKVIIYANPESFPGHPNIVFPLHATVSDSQGKSIVIEFVRGRTIVYDNYNGVLTNAPNFPWQLTNIKNFLNLSPYQPKSITIGGYTFGATGTGSGAIGLPGDYSPPSRFIKMTFAAINYIPEKTAIETVLAAEHMLNNVDIPKGSVRSESGSNRGTETTQWVIFKDLTNKKIYYKTYENSNLRVIDCSKLSLKPGTQIKSMPIKNPMKIENVTEQLQ